MLTKIISKSGREILEGLRISQKQTIRIGLTSVIFNAHATIEPAPEPLQDQQEYYYFCPIYKITNY